MGEDDGADDLPDESRPRFLVDAMSGSLATHLRMCGYDAAYALDRGVEADDALLDLARTEGRRLVTRDRELAKRAEDAVELTDRDVRDQLRTLADAGFQLELPAEPRRCGVCNATLEPVPPRASVPGYAPEPTAESVWRCVACGQHYWRGSHWDDVAETLAGL